MWPSVPVPASACLISPGLALAAAIELGQRLVRRVGAHHQHHGLRSHHRHGQQVFQRVVGHLGEQRRVDRQVGGLAQADGVAVGLGLGDHVHADVAVAARAVVDDEGPLGVVGELLRDEPGHDVGGAAGGVGHDQAHGLVGPGGSAELSARAGAAFRHAAAAAQASSARRSVKTTRVARRVVKYMGVSLRR
jgi:hypothetical protein